MHSRLLEWLVPYEYIALNIKDNARTYPEHVVPCAYIRNLAFTMFWNESNIDDVSKMIGRLLRIAYITPADAKLLNRAHRYTMPGDWDFRSDSVLRRLDDAGITLAGTLQWQ